MDTGTHFVFGIGLAGLAYIDPVVAANPTVSAAVLIGTVVGSQAPDFDGLLRIKGNATYIKNHRGISHSIPAIFIWTLLLTFALSLFFPPLPWLHIGLWIGISVFLHVFSDCFNAYGTQMMRPFSEKWISWNIIHIFDPIIFFSHLIAILAWVLRMAPPSVIFSLLYGLLILYYSWRTIVHYALEQRLPGQDPLYRKGERYILLPTVNPSVWNIVKTKTDGGYALGELRNNQIRWLDEAHSVSHPAAERSKQNKDIAAFLYFTSYACVQVKEHGWGYEVRWVDVRYRHRKQYPFVAVLLMDKQYRTIDSYVGWLSESRIEKKLRMNTF